MTSPVNGPSNTNSRPTVKCKTCGKVRFCQKSQFFGSVKSSRSNIWVKSALSTSLRLRNTLSRPLSSSLSSFISSSVRWSLDYIKLSYFHCLRSLEEARSSFTSLSASVSGWRRSSGGRRSGRRRARRTRSPTLTTSVRTLTDGNMFDIVF